MSAANKEIKKKESSCFVNLQPTVTVLYLVSSSQRVAELGESDGYVEAYPSDIDYFDSQCEICTVLIMSFSVLFQIYSWNLGAWKRM